MKAALLIAAACAAAVTTDAGAQQSVGLAGEPDVPEKAGKVFTARRVTGDAPRIDGVLDDAAWTRADSLADLVQWDPNNMQPPSERTVVRILYDDRYLYVGVRLLDSEPASIVTGLGRRDNAPPSDFFVIAFDTRHDHQTAYAFEVNVSGVRGDFSFADDIRNDRDYNAIWEARTARSTDGWTLEYKIPFSQMRFPTPRAGAVWGLDMRRNIQRKGEIIQWVGRPRGRTGQVSRFGHMIFESALTPPRRIELTPFTLARTVAPHARRTEHDLEGGADARLGLGSAATLAATVLPDFGQIEADPAVLNLSVFETFFPERRPFFLEDADVFRPPYGIFRLFHSRRIGRRPSYLRVPAGSTVLDRPEQTTLLGALKVTGKARGWTYGILEALTDAEYALIERPVAGGTERARALIEPRTSYSAARLQRDFGRTSNVGWLGTAVARDGAPDAFTTGIDYNLRWRQNRWYWNGHWAGSRAPVAGRLETGFGGVSNIGYSAKHYGFFAHVDHFGRKFSIGDMGFLFARVDRTAWNAGINVGQPDPWGIFRNVGVFLGTGAAQNGDGLVFERWINAGLNARSRNFWRWNFNAGFSPELLDDLDTRGGPPIVRPAERWLFGFIGSDTRKRWTIDAFFNRGGNDAGSRFASVSLNGSWNPTPSFQSGIGIGYRHNRPNAQWIRNVDVTGDGAVDHVYGSLESRVVDINLRGTLALHPDLTFELYTQPFVAVGDYSNFRRLARPSSYEFEAVTINFNPDFNSKSLLGNAVLRWEYRPGSTLFLVWNTVGFDPRNPGDFSLKRDLADAFSVRRDDVFMVKASYWLSW